MKKVIFVLSAGFILATAPLYAGNGDLIVNGNLGVGTSSPGAKLDVNGNANVSGNVNVTGTLTATNISATNSGGISNYTPPVLSNFTWVNQGGATAIQQGNNVVLTGVHGTGSSHNLSALVQAAPSPPYTVTLYGESIRPFANVFIEGIILYNSTSSKAVTLAYSNNSSAAYFEGCRWTNMTTYASDTIPLQSVYSLTNTWLQIKDDGTNRYFKASTDGLNWMTLGFTSNTDQMVPDKIGFFYDSFNATYLPPFVIKSFQITTP